jgi:hypothetical protein
MVNVVRRINRRFREYMHVIRDAFVINQPKVLAFNVFTFSQWYF